MCHLEQTCSLKAKITMRRKEPPFLYESEEFFFLNSIHISCSILQILLKENIRNIILRFFFFTSQSTLYRDAKNLGEAVVRVRQTGINV